MSNALAIAAVTAALKNLVDRHLDGLDLSALGSVSVGAMALDRVLTGDNEPNQINLFLYQVSANSGWRNTGLASRDGAGQRVSNPPLALDLHYLLTAFGSQELNRDALFGLGMQALHETPMLDRERLRALLGPPALPFGAFSAESLADQVEWLKITPQYLSAEELSKLWTAAQARFRASMAYQVSVVLIQSDAGVRAARPVLRRGPEDRGPRAVAALPPRLRAIENLTLPGLRGGRLGDLLRVDADGAGAGTHLVLEHARGGLRQALPLLADGPRHWQVQLPAADAADVAAAWAPGLYTLRLRTSTPGQPELIGDAVPWMLAPRITVTPLTAAAGAELALSIECLPQLLSTQQAGLRLLFGGQELPVEDVDTPADASQPSAVHAIVPAALATAGLHPVALRVEGVDSLPVLRNDAGVQFDPQQSVELT
ncbi:DUF4255 domain-containing protein [Stenotrophomonas rhizophila]|uniref:DUF4255 domain-containing protein n=1 Tax=Stenotrophomonas rhizophila TaxID=216778 RepID=UPI0011A54F6F|nr:DUF4255 domain-containing protein [Stenotrophomonas rhizophila]